MKYKTRVVTKTDEEGRQGYRVEFWQFQGGWIDALQGWFWTKERAQAKADAMAGKKVQESLF